MNSRTSRETLTSLPNTRRALVGKQFLKVAATIRGNRRRAIPAMTVQRKDDVVLEAAQTRSTRETCLVSQRGFKARASGKIFGHGENALLAFQLDHLR
jgi:hypothetical protein